MNEEAARSWIIERFGLDATALLDRFVAMVIAENREQNLVSPASVDHIWCRHVLDSAQLIPLAPAEGTWLDIGTGGGFPGLVVGLLRPRPTILVEPRGKRAAFLERCSMVLGLDHVTVIARKVEASATPAAVISARAVGSVENILRGAAACATRSTRWLLPRGRFAETDLATLRQQWSGVFHVEQSFTDPNSLILVLEGVSAR